MELQRGTQIDRYVVDGRIGSGGMAHVYRVRHARLGSLHAVKLLQVPTPSVIERLLREGRAQSSLRHPHIVPVTDVIDVLGAPGLVMEWIDGPSLSQLLGAGRLAVGEVVAVARALFSGIGAAHAAGWVHRDLKPGNILLQRLEAELVPRITDFGLVKALTPTSGDAHATRTGAVMGTPAYMAPEQFIDAASVDHRADVYAMGVVLYELCAGRRPYVADDTWSLLELVRAAEPPPIPPREGLPDGLDEVLRWAMHPELGERAPTTAALAERWAKLPWPPSGWTPATLARAAEHALPRAHELVREPELDSQRTLSATFDPIGSVAELASAEPASVSSVLPAHDLVPPPPSPSVAPTNRRLVTAGLVAAAMAGAAIAATWTVRPADNAAFTATEAPHISDDPVVQGHLDRAWQAALQGNYADALRGAEAATEAAPDAPAPMLLRCYTLMRDGQLRASLDLSDELVARWGTAEGPVGSLVSVVNDQKTTQRIDVPTLRTHLADHPADALARLMAADYCANEGDAFCAEHIDALLQLLPHTPLAYHVAAESWVEVNAMEAAREVVERGLDVSPDDPVLLRILAKDALHSGDMQAARQTLRRLATVDPSGIEQKRLRTRLAALTDDTELLEGLRAELTSASQELRVTLDFHDVLSSTLIGLGRTRDAEHTLLEGLAAADASGIPSDRFAMLLRLKSAAFQRGDLDAAMDYIEQASSVATANPEVIRRDRDRLTTFLLHVKATAAIRAGDVEQAESLLERLRAAPEATVVLTEPIERAIAVARRQPDVVATLDKSLWYGECDRKVTLGDALLQAGDPERALPLLEAGPQRCTRYTDQRAMAVLGYAALAEARNQLGDVDGAREALTKAWALWPRPEPDHVLVDRLRDLETQLASAPPSTP